MVGLYWFLVAVLFIVMIRATQESVESNTFLPSESNETVLLQMDTRTSFLVAKFSSSVLVHVHIPKASGTALSIALATECHCLKNRDPPNCFHCKNVVGISGKKFPYSICRSTGWRAGVHPPYSVMKRYMPHPQLLGNFSKEQITPVYIIMLRSPFERFISEIKKWGGNKGQAVDWSIVNYKDNGTSYFNGANSSFLNSNRDEPDSNFRQRLRLYASLAPELMYHNRHVKMIGGEVSNFNMKFVNSQQLGTRWKTQQPEDMNRILFRAQRILSKERSIVIGLEERFTETLCTLEVLYGDLYRFRWDPGSDTHGHGEKINMQTIVTTSMIDEYPEVYEEWKKHNRHDLELYASAQHLFELQFQATQRLLSGQSTNRKFNLTNIPHCSPYIRKM